jgi:hypothetical protein
MHSQEVRNYLAEIRRTLRPGGRALLTFFIAEGSRDGAALDFRFRVADGWTIDPNTPERAIAYPETWLREAFDAAGLAIQDPIRHGSWSGERAGLDFQDIILAHRRDAP